MPVTPLPLLKCMLTLGGECKVNANMQTDHTWPEAHHVHDLALNAYKVDQKMHIFKGYIIGYFACRQRDLKAKGDY